MSSDDTHDEMLRRILAEIDPAFDPPPGDLDRITSGLFAWRTIEANLAEIEHVQPLSSGVRATELPTALTFVREGTTDVVAVAELDDDSRTLVLDILIDGVVSVVLRRPGAPDHTVETDAAQACHFADVARGPAQLVAVAADGSYVFKSAPLTL